MNNLKNDVSYYNSYFSGIKELYQATNTTTRVKSIVKIASYLSIVTQIFMSLMLFFKKHRLDQVLSLYTRFKIQSGQDFSQTDLFNFLKNKVQDNDNSDQCVEVGFKLLHNKIQANFFNTMTQKKVNGKNIKLDP